MYIQQILLPVNRKSYLLDMINGDISMGVNRTNTDQYQLRLPPGLRERIKAAAEMNKTSMNTEIVERLLHSFKIAGRKPGEVEFLSDDEILILMSKLCSEIQQCINEQQFRMRNQVEMED